MKITVAVELQDSEEVGGLATFIGELEKYRATNASMARAQVMSDPRNGASDPVDPADIVRPSPAAPDPQVVGSITPKAPKVLTVDQLNAAAMKYVDKHGIEKALALVAEYGVAKITDIKDPAKLNEVYQRLLEGVK